MTRNSSQPQNASQTLFGECYLLSGIFGLLLDKTSLTFIFTKCLTTYKRTSKLEKGNKELTPAQYKSIEPRQISEFRRRYGNGNARRGIKSELLIATDSTATVLGCAGVEVDTIRQPWSSGKMVLDVSGSQVRAPLMSNLAVSRSFRRRGIAEELVQQVEELVRKQWGFEECYLYVEKKNSSAIKLYKKLGYKQLWEEENTSTMVPSPMGGLRSGTTTTICMKKVLNKGLFGRFLGL